MKLFTAGTAAVKNKDQLGYITPPVKSDVWQDLRKYKKIVTKIIKYLYRYHLYYCQTWGTRF